VVDLHVKPHSVMETFDGLRHYLAAVEASQSVEWVSV